LVIDGHIHAGYWSAERFLGRGVPFEELDRCLAECGIDGAVLTSTDLRKNSSVIEFIAKSARRRYWFFPWVNPAVNDDLTFVAEHREKIHGLKLHPSCDRVKVTDKRVEPFIGFARDEGLPVMVHCGRWQEMSSYSLVLEVAARYPDVDFILSHMGGDTPELEMATIDAIKKGRLANAYLGTEGVREYWAVQRAVDELGAEKVIFGSDFPLGHPKMYMGVIDALKISDQQRGLVLGGNILRLVGEGGQGRGGQHRPER
jgi:predicted TIM-barrel fold metal-dependent hydrolase